MEWRNKRPLIKLTQMKLTYQVFWISRREIWRNTLNYFIETGRSDENWRSLRQDRLLSSHQGSSAFNQYWLRRVKIIKYSTKDDFVYFWFGCLFWIIGKGFEYALLDSYVRGIHKNRQRFRVMVIWSKFRMRQYRNEIHREYASHFSLLSDLPKLL